MVSKESQQAWVVANHRHHASSVWAPVDGVSQQDKSVLFTEVESMDQGAERGKMAVNVPDSEDVMPNIEPPLKVGFQRVVPSTKVRREFFFARQGCIHQGEVSPCPMLLPEVIVASSVGTVGEADFATFFTSGKELGRGRGVGRGGTSAFVGHLAGTHDIGDGGLDVKDFDGG